jgi:LysR family transcriptional regulator, transcription activator of glutamate synthase operon
MDIRQVRAAVEVGRTGGFTRAAEILGVAQPALSQAVASLERELGVALFERTSRRVWATPAGAAFVERAARILSDVDALSSEMAEHAGVVRGRVVVGSLQLFSETALPAILARFHRLHPDVELALREDVTHEMLAKLRAAELDVAIVNVDDPTPYPDLAFVPLYRDPLAIAVAAAHPLARGGATTMAALRAEDWVTFRRGSGLHMTLLEAARREGFVPRIVVESADTLTLRTLASEGLGVALLPRTFLEAPGPPVAIVELREPKLERAIALASRRGAVQNAAARAFASFLQESFR